MTSMLRKSTLFSLISLLLLSFFVSSQALAGKQYMPEWELKTADGEIIKSSDLIGKPLILHFWATWCPYCKRVQPGLDALYKKYQDKGLQMVAISFNEDEGAEPQKVIEERGHSFKTLVNGDMVANKLFSVTGTPTTYFIHADGSVLVSTKTSKPDDRGLEEAVKMLFRKMEKMEKKRKAEAEKAE